MITLDTVLAEFHSVQIKDADGDALAISATGAALIEAVDLDIRNLVFADDKVDVSGSEVSLDSATLAALENITVTQGTSPWVVSGTVELGATTLAALENITVSATDLDIRNLVFATDKVDVSGSSIEIVEAGYDTWQVTNVSVTTTESTVSALANRLRVEIQNLGNNDIYIRQSTGVSSSNGLKIPKGSSYEQALDAGAAIYMVAASGTSDVRIAQYAA